MINKIKIMERNGCLTAVLLLLASAIFVVCGVFFNAWYLQEVYEIGLVTIFSQFNVVLPEIGYWFFALIWVTYGAFHLMFKTDWGKDNETKESADNVEVFSKIFSTFISQILTKCLQLLILSIICSICIA